MRDSTSDSDSIAIQGTLHWNEFEGGFWSLAPADATTELGASVVLDEFTPPAGATDGSHLQLQVRARPDVADFLMAGTRVDVLAARLL